MILDYFFPPLETVFKKIYSANAGKIRNNSNVQAGGNIFVHFFGDSEEYDMGF